MRVPHIGQVYARVGLRYPRPARRGTAVGAPKWGAGTGTKKVRIGLDKAGGVRKIVPAGGGPLRRTGADCPSEEVFGGSGAHNSGKHAGSAVV